MHRSRRRLAAFVFLSGIPFFCFANDNTENRSPRIYVQPVFSYKMTSFEGIAVHNPAGGLSVTGLNPASGNLFAVTAMYALNIAGGIQNGRPDMYHAAVLSLNGKTGRHSFLGAFTANTDKPLYGGLHTFSALAGYTHDLVNRPHFSMDAGGYVLFRDIGINLPGGTPWLLWPLPFLSLKWDYEWIDVSFLPGITITAAGGKPVSFTVSKKSGSFDMALWYHCFGNKKAAAEIFGIGIGLRDTAFEVMTAAGDAYGMNYWALYGSMTVFRLVEITGGWIFSGKEKYGRVNWDNILETYGHSGELDFGAGSGKGFFFSVSARLVF